MSKRWRTLVGMGCLAGLNAAVLGWIYWKSGAGQPHRVRILSATPTTDVDTADRIGLMFDLPLADDAAIGRAPEKPLFDLRPPHPGTWKWAAANRLEFQLGAPLRPGMTYLLKPTDALTPATGHVLVGPAEFRFETRALAVDACELDSADATHLNVRLQFNQSVEPDALMDALIATDGVSRASLDSVCLTRQTSRDAVIRIERPDSGQLSLRLKQSLTGAGAERGLMQPYLHRMTVDAPFAIEQVHASATDFGELHEVRLDFNRQLKSGQPQPAIVFDPPVAKLQKAECYWDEVHVKGAFVCGQRYRATVKAGLLDRDDRPLEAEQVITFVVPDRSEAIRFSQTRGVLSPHGNLLLDLKTVNTHDVNVVVSKLHENNLVPHLRGDESAATSRDLVRETLKIDAPRNRPTDAVLDLKGLLERPLGIYHVQARSAVNRWTEDETVVAVTDLGISIKREQGGLFAWVTSLRTAEPQAGVSVKALSFNNQVIVETITDDDGRAHLQFPPMLPDGPPYVIVAQRDEDLNYCLMGERTWVPQHIDLSGRTPPATYDVMLYCERGLYRPGDTIHVSGIIRTAEGAVPPAFPIWVRTRRPDGKEMGAESIAPRPENQGLFHVAVQTHEDDQLGEYRFTATLPGSNEVLGETTALVEAFLPLRLEMSAAPTKPVFTGAENPAFDIQGDYLFGKPAAGVGAAVSARYREKRFVSKAHPHHRFGRLVLNQAIETGTTTGTLDEKGQARLEIAPPGGPRPAVWDALAVATLTETGSRSVSALIEFEHVTAKRHLGLALESDGPARVGMPLRLSWVQLDNDQRPAPAAAFTLNVDRVEHDWVLQELDGRLTWKSVERRTPVIKAQKINDPPTAASGSLEIQVDAPGAYLVMAVEEDGGAAAEFEFRAIDRGQGNAWAASPEPDAVLLTLAEGPFRTGTVAECLVQAPFEGRLLLTVEDAVVRESRVVDLKTSPTKVEFLVPRELRGDAFVTATLVRPIDPSRKKWLPNVARGITRLPITQDAGTLPVLIDGPDALGAEECATFVVHATPPSDPSRPPVIHLWAVDDGILLSSAYDAPDPLAHFFGPRALSVETSDMFASLLPDTLRAESMLRIGADADDKEEITSIDPRRNPVPTQRREPAVVWLASRPADEQGRAFFEIPMPDINSRMRVMAVAADGDRYGKASQSVLVRSPLVLEAGWPRFLAPGDRCRVPVKVFNHLKDAVDVTLSVASQGGIEISPQRHEIHVTPSTPALVWVDIVAESLGPVNVELWAVGRNSENGDTTTTHASTSFPVRPATALDQVVAIQRLIAGDSLTLPAPDGFIPGTVNMDIEVSSTPDVELRPAVDELLDYPYGCVEQTTSRLWALLRAGEIVRHRIEEDSRYGRIDDMIRAGLTRLWAMQTRSGGLAYWPGSQETCTWGTVYAATVIAEASRSGHSIDAGFKKDLLAYLTRTLNASDRIELELAAQICEVLSVFDQPNQGWMARLSERADELDLHSRTALARAWFHAGNRDQARAVLPKTLPQFAGAKSSGGGALTDTTRLASLLRTLRMIDKESPYIALLTQRLRDAAANGVWRNTMENAAAIAALAGTHEGDRAAADFQGNATIDGQAVAFSHERPLRLSRRASKDAIELNTKGQGDMLVIARHTGLRADANVEFDRGLRVSREWYRPDGASAGSGPFTVGDLLTVTVTLACPGLDSGEFIENVAIVDALPAGFEVENPRLATSANVNDAQHDPDNVQLLDDRVLLFASATKEPRTFRYQIRATSAGTFKLPPIEASSMYDPSLASARPGGVVEIVP